MKENKEFWVLAVPGMEKPAAENKIRDTLQALNGVYDVRINREVEEVKMWYDPDSADVDKLKAAVEDAGYPVEWRPALFLALYLANHEDSPLYPVDKNPYRMLAE